MIYFVETNRGALRPADLEPLGLAHILDRGEALATVAASGKTPGGKSGLLLCNKTRWGTDGLRLDHDWSGPLPGLDSVVWVACPTKPKPEELRRKGELLKGVTLVDARGEPWTLPLVRKVDEAGDAVSALPCYLRIGPEGVTKSREPKEEFRYLWDATQEPWDRLCAAYAWEREYNKTPKEERPSLGPPPDLTDGDVLRWLTPIVAANYVVGAPELFALDAFDDTKKDPWLGWLSVAISFTEHMVRCDERDEQKKTEGDGSASDPNGSTTCSGATDAA